jgi:2-keto-3-deoxy-L-rhamnonate aldolase RhmA
MRENTLKQKLVDGQAVVGTTLAFPCPELVEACGLLGFDFVFIDGEHDGTDPIECGSLVRAADAVGVQSVVRVPRNDPQTILGYLETGALSIIAPHVNTADEVLAGIQAVRYPPDGIRGAGSSTRAANYGITQSATDHFGSANAETLFMPLLEEALAFDHLDEILQVPGLEVIQIGTGDLALSMGYPGQLNHPAVQERVQHALTKAKQAGIIVGTASRDAASTRALIDRGFQMILTSSTAIFTEAVRTFMRDAGLTATPGGTA